MKKALLTIVFSIFTYYLLISPFLLPDEWTYIKHCKSEIHPVANVLMSISIFIIVWLAGCTVVRFYDNLFDELEE
jgi:hypothetical protein